MSRRTAGAWRRRSPTSSTNRRARPSATSISTTTAFRIAAFPTFRKVWRPAPAVRRPVDVPRSTWYGIKSGPNPDQELIDAHVATARIVHEFTNDIKITNTTRYVNVDRLNRATLPNNTTTFFEPRRQYRPGRQWTEVSNELWANNTDFCCKVLTPAGCDTAWSPASTSPKKTGRRSAGRTPRTRRRRTNPYDPDPYRFGGTFGRYGAATISDATTVGAYFADQVKITDWFELLGGVRYDNFKAEVRLDNDPQPA